VAPASGYRPLKRAQAEEHSTKKQSHHGSSTAKQRALSSDTPGGNRLALAEVQRAIAEPVAAGATSADISLAVTALESGPAPSALGLNGTPRRPPPRIVALARTLVVELVKSMTTLRAFESRHTVT